MNKFLLIIVAGLLVIGGAWLIKNNNKTQSDENIKTYKNLGLGITFNYPKYLTASTTDGVIVLHHDIAFENNGDCDMMGDENTYPRLTDFKVTIQKINKNLVSTMKAVSPYIPQENFVNDEVVVSPGFIDAFEVGTLRGYAIYEGAEGCGQTTYYFPIKSDETLVINKASIQVLSGVTGKEKQDMVLAIPEVISKEKSEEIFISILKTLEI